MARSPTVSPLPAFLGGFGRYCDDRLRTTPRARFARRQRDSFERGHPLLVWYSQEARPYSLLTLAGALSLLFFVRSWVRAQRRDFLLSAAAVSVHYFAAFLVVSEAIALLVLHRDRWRSLALGLVPIAVVSLGLLPTLREQRRHAELLGRYLIAAMVPLLIAAAIGLASPTTRRVGLAGVAVFCVASLVTLTYAARAPSQQRPPWREVAGAFEDDGNAPPGPAALVLDRYGNLASPLGHYLGDDVRPLDGDEEAWVTTIDVVELLPWSPPCNFYVGSTCAYFFLGGHLPPELDSLFQLEARREVGPFRINRYRTDTPVRLSKETIVPFGTEGALVMIRP